MNNQIEEANKIIKSIIKILDIKARQGCRQKEDTWVGIQNGNGIEIGEDIEKIILKSKKYIKKYEKNNN